ncbi:MAG: hypothetical protein ABFD60_16655 [Bryobacteraceae bacterium]
MISRGVLLLGLTEKYGLTNVYIYSPQVNDEGSSEVTEVRYLWQDGLWQEIIDNRSCRITGVA